MSPNLLQRELEGVGRTILWWRARLQGLYWAAVVIAFVLLLGISDLAFGYGRVGRFVGFGVIVCLILAAMRRIKSEMSRKQTVESVASEVERAFPSLDNHLINYVQFASGSRKDVFVDAYVRRGVPEWGSVRVGAMMDRRAQLKAYVALLGAIIAIMTPFLFFSQQAWTTALMRVVNPFSDISPASLTRVLSVKPGNVTVLQGSVLTVKCEVRGKNGHKVWLDIQPDDNKERTYVVGELAGMNSEEFQHSISKVNTPLKYRFRAGDAPRSGWYRVETRPPLAFSKIRMSITPPAYTGLAPKTSDGLAEPVDAPQGSEVNVHVECNMVLKSATMAVNSNDPEELPEVGDKRARAGMVKTDGSATIKLAAINGFDEKTETAVDFRMIPDRPPVIQVTAPKGRTILNPGAVPTIDFAVSDDYGLTAVSVERLAAGAGKKGTSGEAVGKWDAGGRKEFVSRWEGGAEMVPKPGEPLMFLVVAVDNCKFKAHRNVSEIVVFDAAGVQTGSQKEKDSSVQDRETLSSITEMQRQNLQNTGALKASLGASTRGQWGQVTDKQRSIRELAAKLLASPVRIFGNRTQSIRRIYANEMVEAVKQLARASETDGKEREQFATRSIELEDKILRELTAADVTADKSQFQKKLSGLLALLQALVKGETKVLADTKQAIAQKAPVGKAVVDKQDSLASDLSEFVTQCRNEAPALKQQDAALSAHVAKAADECEKRKIRADMLVAAEKLEAADPQSAVPREESALKNLVELQQLLNEWQVAAAKEEIEEEIEALKQAKSKIEKLTDLEKKILEEMRQIKAAENKDNKNVDKLEDELEEVHKQMKEAMLQVARDLHIFPNLSVANDLAEDVYSAFEECAFNKDSQSEDAKVGETALLKNDGMLEAMKNAKGRMEEMEMWLSSDADTVKRTTESFDAEELPIMALGALSTEIKDIVGDLQKAQEKVAKEADDAATNHAVPDMTPSSEIAEGEIASFAAQGKSGNQEPDHKEQSGRSIVGRQGQAVGETAAGSGTIGEGDKNIEKRQTTEPQQSGQIQADGEADENATGGGKQASGSADEFGMAGQGKRMDSTAPGSLQALQAMMATRAEVLAIKASALNLRTESLSEAAHHMRQASDAIAKGMPISQVKEFQKRAVAKLKNAATELDGGAIQSVGASTLVTDMDDLVEGQPEEAPPSYRGLVADYFKSLHDSL